MMIKLCILLLAQTAAAGIEPGWNYRVLQTPHFELIYRDSQKDLAKRYALAAEQAHELLFPIFKEGPDKTIVVLQDDTDSSNGLANFLPYPHIRIYPVLPATGDSIGDYGDWPLEMMLHEYTHILNMYPAHGIYAPLKWIFGSVIRPNALLPRWYLEGLAVNLESWLSDHGRLRARETHAAARALALSGRLQNEDVSRMNESGVKTWPYGARPYLFGGWWWEQVHREKGSAVIETWNQNFSRRLPFFLNGPMLEQTKRSTADLARASAKALEAQSRKQLALIKASVPHTSAAVAEDSGEQSVFAVSPSGMKLVYWLSNPGSGARAKLKVRTQRSQPFGPLFADSLFKTAGTSRVRWMGEDSLVFDQMDTTHPYVAYRDLYRYDLASRTQTRLTTGARALEPSPSPSGAFVAFVQNDGGRNRLALLDMGTLTFRILVNGNLNQRISGPEFLNENEVLFAVRQKDGSEVLHVHDLSKRQTKVWNTKLKSAQNPRLTREGVLVTDAGTGARNVYLVKQGQVRALSNTLTDIETLDFDPGRREILISELSADGRRLRTIPFKETKPPRLELVSLPPPPLATTHKVKVTDESYQPLSYLLPRYWIPFVYQVEDGLIFQGMTSNQDPMGRHQYSLLASYDTVTQKPSYGMSYVNSSLPTQIGLSYARAVSYLGASDLTLESQSAGVSFTNRWPFNSRHARWSVGGLWDETEGVRRKYLRMGPEISWQYSRLSSPLNDKLGVHAEFAHQEFLPQDEYLDYGHSYAFLASQLELWKNHRVMLQTRGAVAPNLPFSRVIDLGDRNVGGNYLINLANSQFLLRGYPSGTFVGRKVVNANLEYVLPALDFDQGLGTFPLFFRNLELALFADTMAVDGAGFRSDLGFYTRSSLGEFYTGTGGELRLNTTTAYHVPLSLTVGLYYGLNDRFGGGLSPFFGIGFGGLSALEDKTP